MKKIFYTLSIILFATFMFGQNNGPSNYTRSYMGCVTSAAPTGTPDSLYGCVEVLDTSAYKWYVWNHDSRAWVLQTSISGFEIDPIYASDSANIVWWADTLSTIATQYDLLNLTESNITDLTHFVNADETDQVYAGDSANIVWFTDTLTNIASQYDLLTLTESNITDLVHTTDYNLGDDNLTLSGNRTVTMGGNELAFDGGDVNINNKIDLKDDGTIRWGASGGYQGWLSWDSGKAIVYAQTGNSLELGADNSRNDLVINTANDIIIGNLGVDNGYTDKLQLNGDFGADGSMYSDFFSTTRRDSIVFFGDSFSSLIGNYFLSNILSRLGSEGETHGVGGYKINQVVDTLDALLLADPTYFNDKAIVHLLVGVNDFASNYPLGSMSSSVGDADYYGGLKEFIETITDYDIKLFISTPTEANGAGVLYKATNSAGYTLEDIADAIGQVCSYYGIKVIDLYHNSGFNLQTIPNWTSDLLHPNSTGGAILGKIVASAISNDIGTNFIKNTNTNIGNSDFTINGDRTLTFSNNNLIVSNANLNVDNSVYLNEDGTIDWGSAGGHGELSWDTEKAIIIGKSGMALSLGSNAAADKLYIQGASPYNVGIGTTTPLSKLHLNGGVGTLSTGLSFGDGDSGLYESTDDNFVFPMSSINFSGGNVGIGKTPTTALDVSGSIKASSNITAAGNIFAHTFGQISWDTGLFRMRATTGNAFSVGSNNRWDDFTIDVSGDALFSGDILPSTTLLSDLGSSSKKYAEAHFDEATIYSLLKITPQTSASASGITPANGMIVYVSDTDATFTSVGFWGYENSAWTKL